MENNPEIALAWQFIENTGTHLFLTGKAGTGKTTFLRKLRAESPKRMIVLAPTGIAAINAGGVTIHSFFQLPFAPFIPDTTFNTEQKHFRFSKEKINIIRSMDLLIIDDLGIERSTEFALEQVFNVIDSRYRSKLPLIVTTNMTLEELKNPQDLTRSRIYDRVLERCVPLRINNQNIRQRNAAESMKEARKILESGTGT